MRFGLKRFFSSHKQLSNKVSDKGAMRTKRKARLEAEPLRVLGEVAAIVADAQNWLRWGDLRLSELAGLLDELRLMREATRRGGRAISWGEVVEIVKMADPDLGARLQRCEPRTVRLGKIQAYAPDGATYATVNLFRDTIQQALETEYKTPFKVLILHKLS